MEGDEEHTPGGEAAGEVVAGMVDEANERAAAAENAAQAVTDAAVQQEVVRTVETRLGEFETWQGETNRRLGELQSNQERLLGLMTEQTAMLETAMRSQQPPQPAPPPEPSPEPQPQTEPSTPPQQPHSPADAADAAPAPAAKPPEPHAPRSKPKRRFW